MSPAYDEVDRVLWGYQHLPVSDSQPCGQLANLCPRQHLGRFWGSLLRKESPPRPSEGIYQYLHSNWLWQELIENLGESVLRQVKAAQPGSAKSQNNTDTALPSLQSTSQYTKYHLPTIAIPILQMRAPRDQRG